MPPVNFLVKPASGNCNLKCKYCFYRDVQNNRQAVSSTVMSVDTQETMIKEAMRYADIYCSFAFQGGEPMLAGMDYFKRHADLLKKYNTKHIIVNNSIQTNGTLITDEWAKFFAENRFLVGLSLDGYAAIHDKYRVDPVGNGTHATVMKAAETLRKNSVEFNILCVVNKSVARSAEKVYKFFRDNGFGNLQFIPCLDDFGCVEHNDFSLTSEDYGEFLLKTFDLYFKDFIAEKYVSIRNFDNYVMMFLNKIPESCGMRGICNSYFTVDGDGGVYPCDYYVLEKYCMGSIKLQRLDELSASYAAKNFVDASRSVDIKCKTCKYFPICRGGCRRNRDRGLGNGLSLNVFCDAYYGFFDCNLERLRTLAAIVLSKQKGDRR